MNVSEHKQKFIQEMKRRGYSQNSIINYESCIQVFLSKIDKDHPKNINENEIKNFLSTCIRANTQRNYQSAIKLFYEICLNQKNKFKNIPYTKTEKKLPIVLSQEEVQKMFDVCENTKHKVILALLYSTGMRVSELISLKWEHLDRSRGIINIIGGKGNKDRQVMLSNDLHPLLEKYWKEHKSLPYILKGQFSEQYSDRSVGQVMKQLAKKAGINKRVYTHLMRHNCFTHLVENGIDINLIQKLAGHSNVKTTLVYTHILHNIISNISSPLSQIKMT